MLPGPPLAIPTVVHKRMTFVESISTVFCLTVLRAVAGSSDNQRNHRTDFGALLNLYLRLGSSGFIDHTEETHQLPHMWCQTPALVPMSADTAVPVRFWIFKPLLDIAYCSHTAGQWICLTWPAPRPEAIHLAAEVFVTNVGVRLHPMSSARLANPKVRQAVWTAP